MLSWMKASKLNNHIANGILIGQFSSLILNWPIRCWCCHLIFAGCFDDYNFHTFYFYCDNSHIFRPGLNHRKGLHHVAVVFPHGKLYGLDDLLYVSLEKASSDSASWDSYHSMYSPNQYSFSYFSVSLT